MTKPLTERLRMAAQSLRNLAPMWRKLYADSAENADRSAEAIDEAADLLDAIDKITRPHQPEAKRTIPRSN